MINDNPFQHIAEYEQKSLYSFQNEHDACGVGLVVSLNGDKSHETVECGLQVLENMVHRGQKAPTTKLEMERVFLFISHTNLSSCRELPSHPKANMGQALSFFPRISKEQMNTSS